MSDVGALGYGGRRFVNVNPVLGLFQKVTEIDTNQINRDEWIYVDREGDIKMPWIMPSANTRLAKKPKS